MNTANGLPLHIRLVHAVHLPRNEQIREHADIGGTASFFAIALAPGSKAVTRLIEASWDGKVTSAPYFGG